MCYLCERYSSIRSALRSRNGMCSSATTMNRSSTCMACSNSWRNRSCSWSRHVPPSEVKAIDLRFMDFPGLWKHFTIPAEVLDEDKFEDGIGFDGSSIRGWMPINESDMLLVPQPDTLFIDPFCKDVTLAMICNVQDPVTKEDYSKDPRNVARKAVNYMKSTGVADAAVFGPSLAVFVFDDVKFDQTTHSAFYYVDSGEGAWNTGRDERPNLGYKVPYRQGYFPCPPTDAVHDLRGQMMLAM